MSRASRTAARTPFTILQHHAALAFFVAFLPFATFLTGCSTSTPPRATVTPAATGLQGIVHGGQQPVSGSTVQLWAVGASGDGSPATSLLDQTITTAGNGTFNITGHYTCPTSSTLVYLTATGGNPGLSSGTNNSALAMMAALGTCGSLSASTYIYVNEVTTVGAAFALAPYMTSYSSVGSYTSDASALATAFNTANEFANTTNGTPSGPALPTGYAVDNKLIYTLADILAACINSTGATSTACSSFFNTVAGAPPTDTLTAALRIANNTTYNTGNLFGLILPNAPYLSIYTTNPYDFTLKVLPKVATPVITPNGGTYGGEQKVTMTDATPNAIIYYTTDGTTPTTSSNSYSTPFSIPTSETINAIAKVYGDFDSDITSATFTLQAFAGNSGTINTVAGSDLTVGAVDGIPATLTDLSAPTAIAFDAAGNLYIADSNDHRVRKVTPSGIISNFAGTGDSGSSGNGGPAIAATLEYPDGLAFDRDGSLYIADGTAGVVRKVSTSGVITAFAGSGPGGIYADGIAATSAMLNTPTSLAFDVSGNLYIADYGHNDIRKVSSSGIISTVAGNGGAYNGENIAATDAGLGNPWGIAVDAAGNLFISDYQDNRVRKVNALGIISTIAGDGSYSFGGDGGPAISASLRTPMGLALDGLGNLYVSDSSNHRIRKIAIDGTITTVAGDGNTDNAGDGEQATSASINYPEGLGFDSRGNLFIADAGNARIREVYH